MGEGPTMKSAEVSSNIQYFANQAIDKGDELFNKARLFLGTTAAALSLIGAAYAVESMADVQPAEAATKVEFVNDYPDMDAWDCTFPFGYFAWCKGIPATPISPRGYNYRNCTDGAAYWVNRYTGVNPKNLGNAKEWDDNATPYTVLSGDTNSIEPGDVAESDDGDYGHAGFVTSVAKDTRGNVTSFSTAELNAATHGEYSSHTYDTRNSANKFVRGAFDWDHFIDFNGLGKGLGNAAISAEFPYSPANTMDRPLGVAAHANGEQDVFWRDGNGNLREAWWGMDRRWHGPIYVNGGMRPLGSAPVAVVRPGNNEQDVFWKGKDSNLWRAYYDGSWHGPYVLGDGPLGSQPTAAAWGNEIDVFWKGTNGNLWESWQPCPTCPWYGPKDLGMGPLGSAPTAMAHANGEQDVFWRGTDGGLWEGYYFPWENKWHLAGLGMGQLGTAPTAVWVPGKNEQDVFWMGGDSNIWQTAYIGGRWANPIFVGKGPLGGAPSAAAWGNETDIFWPGMDHNLWETAGNTFNFGNLFGLGMGPIPTS